MNRMQQKPMYTVPMDILGLSRRTSGPLPQRESLPQSRHDEPFLTIIDSPHHKEDSMRHDTFITLKDSPAGDLSANNLNELLAQLVETNPAVVAAAIRRVGVNASQTEILAACQRPVTPREGRAYLLDEFNKGTEKFQAEERARRLQAEVRGALSVPLAKRINPAALRFF